MENISEIKKAIQEKGIEFFLCSFVEMSGVPKAKLVPAEHLEDMIEGSAGFAGFAAGNMGQGPHDLDMIAIPDFNSLTQLPWRKNIAWVASNIYVDDKPWPYCPRTILQRQLSRAEDKGYVFKTGVEPEFLLLSPDDDGTYQPHDPMDVLQKPCYDLGALGRNLDFMTTLVRYMQELGWDPYANDHEDANCQFEINWTYSDALRTADRHTFYRWMVKTCAEQEGLVATFMPKPFDYLTGNGAHFHMSLWGCDPMTVAPVPEENLFLNNEDENGLSELAYHFIGGLKHSASAVTAVTAPTVNSYKRLVSGAPRSGATWAPVFVTYGGSNRTQMIRIPGPGRIENRTVDGSTNSYLAATVMLAAGLNGIDNKLPAGERNDRNLYEVTPAELESEGIQLLPSNLSAAVDELSQDPVILDALGNPYGDYYVATKREEWKNYHDSVSSWEIDQYLGLF